MATQQVFHATNVVVPAAPPTFWAPSTAGSAVPSGGLQWQLLIDSAGYAAGSSADLTVEYQYSGVWVSDVSAGGFSLGTISSLHGPTTVNSLASSIGVRANPYPARVRLRVDRIPAGTLASITVNIS